MGPFLNEKSLRMEKSLRDSYERQGITTQMGINIGH